MKNILSIYLSLIFLCVISSYSLAEKSLESDDSFPIQRVFPNKIVYTTDMSADQDLLKKHCEQQNGFFNECGSVCDDSSSGVCIAVCAFTCELRNKNKLDKN